MGVSDQHWRPVFGRGWNEDSDCEASGGTADQATAFQNPNSTNTANTILRYQGTELSFLGSRSEENLAGFRRGRCFEVLLHTVNPKQLGILALDSGVEGVSGKVRAQSTRSIIGRMASLSCR